MDWANAKLSHDINVPFYLQFASFLRRKIDDGELMPGEKLPVSKDLQKIFSLSSITVENGIHLLVQEGRIIRRQRRGSFVAVPKEVKHRTGCPKRCVKVILREIAVDGFFWQRIIYRLGQKFHEINCDILPLDIEWLHDLSVREIAKDCSGIVMLGVNSSEMAEKFYKQKIPFVLIGGLDSPSRLSKKFDMIQHDDVHRAYSAVRHLLLLGHRRIGTIRVIPGSQYTLDMLEGAKLAMREFQIPEENLLTIPIPNLGLEEGERNAVKLLCSNADISALFLPDPPFAAGVLKAAQELGFQIPRDLSIITIGYPWLCSITNPPITTFPDAEDEISEAAVEHLLKQMEHPGCETENLRIRTEELIVQKSTRRFDSESISSGVFFSHAVQSKQNI